MNSNDITVVTHYPACQLARCLGISEQGVYKALAHVPPRTIQSAGRVVKAWPFTELPSDLRCRLESLAAQRGFGSVAEMLQLAAGGRRPAVELSPAQQAQAARLREAFAPTLARLDDLTVSAGEREGLGVEDYRRVFGFLPSRRHWRRLLKKIFDNDAGERDWTRLDLYADPKTQAHKPATAPAAAAIVQAVRQHMGDVFRQVQNKVNPTPDDRAFLFHAAFECQLDLEARHPGRPASRAIKSTLLDWLHKACPALAKSLKSLRRVFEMKLKLWDDGERSIDALQDRRPLDSGNFCREDFTEDKKKLRNRAVQLDGNFTLAYRQLYQEHAFSQAFMDRHTLNLRVNKSYVPGSIRADVAPRVEALLPIHHGLRTAKLAGPSIMRNYDDVAPGDWFSADDWTPEIYYWTNDENGQPVILRGECLLFIDVRSRYPLGFRLIAGHYNSEHIRSQILRVHDTHGLPHRGFQFENGVWRGRLVESVGHGALAFRETERGLCAPGIGLRIRRTFLPRGKVIEGIFNVLQNSQRDLPGYCGPNEQVQKMERLQKFIALARGGKVHPGEQLMEMSEWRKVLDKACLDYAAEPQNGKMLDGISPAECWTQRAPLRQLPGEGRYILATHQTKTAIRNDGLWITVRGQRRNYYNEHTGSRIGQSVLAFYNVEQPDLLTCCDLDKTHFFTAMHRELPAFDATAQQFAAVNADRAAHTRHVRAEYDEIAHAGHRHIIRDNVIDDSERQLGEQHNAAVAEHRTAQAESTRKLRKIQVTAAAAGIAVPGRVRDPDRVLQGVELEKQIRAQIAQQEKDGTL